MTEHPKVKTRAIRNKRGGIWDLWITCPYCRKKHHHGGGRDDKPMYGFRVPHCVDMGMPEYELIPEE